MESIDMVKRRRLEGVEYKPCNEMVAIKMVMVMVMVMVSRVARYRKRSLLGRYYPR
jgi:hypothetical protein